MILQALRRMQLGNMMIYLPACVLPQGPSIPKKLRAPELRSVDLVFNHWKGSWVTLLVSFSCSSFYLAPGKERRVEIILYDLGINPIVGSEGSGGPKYPLGCSWDGMQTPSPPALRSLITFYVYTTFLIAFAEETGKIMLSWEAFEYKQHEVKPHSRLLNGFVGGNIRGEMYFWGIVTPYGACAAWGFVASCAGSLLSAVSLVCGLLGLFFLCKLPHAAPNASYNKSNFVVGRESFARPGALHSNMRMHL